jgi:hypothetical protein
VAISFPTSLDNFTNPSSGNTLDSPSHSLQHSDINDAVEALEAKLGIGASPAGSASAGQVLTISAAGTSTWSTPTPGGLVLLNTTSFSAVSSQPINNVFTATYDNYFIQLNVLGSGTAGITTRLRAAGTDTTTGYSGNTIFGIYTSATINGANQNNGGSIETTVVQTTHQSAGELSFLNPQTAARTTYFARDMGVDYYRITNGQVYNTTQYDGFNIICASGTMTGSVKVYGYAK